MAARMLAGPSIVGVNVCRVSMAWALSTSAAGTAFSGHCLRTCSASNSTSAKTGHTFLRSSVQLMYSAGSTSSAF